MLRYDNDGNKLNWNHLRSVQSSKGIGEPPLFLGSSVFFALRDAVKDARRMNGQSVGEQGDKGWKLDSPATAERLRLAVGDELVRRAEVKRGEGERSFFVSVA
jgi:xanthine dehydrogenase/oxidase